MDGEWKESSNVNDADTANQGDRFDQSPNGTHGGDATTPNRNSSMKSVSLYELMEAFRRLPVKDVMQVLQNIPWLLIVEVEHDEIKAVMVSGSPADPALVARVLGKPIAQELKSSGITVDNVSTESDETANSTMYAVHRTDNDVNREHDEVKSRSSQEDADASNPTIQLTSEKGQLTSITEEEWEGMGREEEEGGIGEENEPEAIKTHENAIYSQDSQQSRTSG